MGSGKPTGGRPRSSERGKAPESQRSSGPQARHGEADPSGTAKPAHDEAVFGTRSRSAEEQTPRGAPQSTTRPLPREGSEWAQPADDQQSGGAFGHHHGAGPERKRGDPRVRSGAPRRRQALRSPPKDRTGSASRPLRRPRNWTPVWRSAPLGGRGPEHPQVRRRGCAPPRSSEHSSQQPSHRSGPQRPGPSGPTNRATCRLLGADRHNESGSSADCSSERLEEGSRSQHPSGGRRGQAASTESDRVQKPMGASSNYSAATLNTRNGLCSGAKP
jgi:hypothetical protein